ncbi:hypothetical protein M758_8G098800 [Ceratodon purpureus]|uniref:3-oxo-5-alpha-steroid 4-dehydrogenase C-terminal domain-containing protein n=1 Tax=Ceratodon purpureus TaxID=3225 RepID=A0A8T0GZ57_CERPU|nr:hypothetical protein KC19_8G103400 [Ceratodon purpureus]KAG0608349.1 hypothetical protein M758_8G098800 [Ceratodon purpureus]
MKMERSVRIQVLSRDGRELFKGGIEVPAEGTIADLKKAIQKRNSKYYPERQRITLPPTPGQAAPASPDATKKLKDCFAAFGIDRPQVVFKDLGPQVSYRTLFCVEYLGPLLIYPLFYFFPALYTVFGRPERTVTHPVQTYALIQWTVHYLKREFETFFVHRFSHATSPLSNVFRNSAHYWTFAFFISYHVNHPWYKPVSETQMWVGFGISVVCQLSNFYCHVILRNLRPADGTSGYQIPSGFLFDYVTCANYTTEVWQWIGFVVATGGGLASYLFLGVAMYFMTGWALQKHKRLNKMFDGKDGRKKYPRRWVIFPPVL